MARTYDYYPGRAPALGVGIVVVAAIGLSGTVLGEQQSIGSRVAGAALTAAFVVSLLTIWMTRVSVVLDERAGVVAVDARAWPLPARRRGAWRVNEIVDVALEETPKGTTFLALVLKSGQRVPLSDGYRSRRIQARARDALREMLCKIEY
jgi:hypothetical protein